MDDIGNKKLNDKETKEVNGGSTLFKPSNHYQPKVFRKTVTNDNATENNDNSSTTDNVSNNVGSLFR